MILLIYRCSTIPLTATFLPTKGCFYLPQRLRLDTGDVTLCHQQQIMWWQSCRRDHFKTARNSWKNANSFSVSPNLGSSLGSFVSADGDENRKPTSQLKLIGPTLQLNESNIQNTTLRIQSPSQMMIGVYDHLLRKVFRFHYHSQKVIGSLGQIRKESSAISSTTSHLVGGWTNPFAKIFVKMGIFTK